MLNHQHKTTHSLPPASGGMNLLLFAAVIWLAGCDKPKPHVKDSGMRATDFPTNVIAYQAKGVLREIRAGGTKALIAHEEIPGYMEAMTMLLDVRPTNALTGIQIGDQFTFRLLTTDTDAWIDNLKRTGLNISQPQSLDADSVVVDEELKPGDPLPDCVLTNQLGRPIRLSEFRGRALAFTFIFTRCPLPTYCPRMNNNLAAAQKALATANAGTNWHLLSISFDPEFDTPAMLSAYASSYRYDPAHWSFATGATADIRKLGNNFSLTFVREGAVFNHNVRTVVVDTAGRVRKIFAGNEWQPAELVEAIQQAMQAQP